MSSRKLIQLAVLGFAGVFIIGVDAGCSAKLPVSTSTPATASPTSTPTSVSAALPTWLSHRLTYFHYATVDRPRDTLPIFGSALLPMVRELYADPSTVAALRKGDALPDDARFVMETYLAQIDARGQPLSDTDGRLLKDRLVAVESNVHVLRDDGIRGWQPDFIDPDSGLPVSVNFNECSGCHRAAEDGSIYTKAALLRAIQTKQVQLLVCDRQGRRPCPSS